MNDEEQQAYFTAKEKEHEEEQESHRVDLAEKTSNEIDWVMTIADDPELVEFYGLEK